MGHPEGKKVIALIGMGERHMFINRYGQLEMVVRCYGESKGEYRFNVSIFGKKRERCNFPLKKGTKEKQMMGSVTMYLGGQSGLSETAEVRYLMPSGMTIEYQPSLNALFKHFSPLDALVEAEENHGIPIPEKERRYLPGYNEEDKL